MWHVTGFPNVSDVTAFQILHVGIGGVPRVITPEFPVGELL
jgi:hypothetical protein